MEGAILMSKLVAPVDLHNDLSFLNIVLLHVSTLILGKHREET